MGELGLTSNQNTVVIADSDADARSLVSALLARAGIPSIEAGTSDEALTAVREMRPALVLCDVGLQEVSGYEVCREVKQAHGESLAVILLSGTRTDPNDCAAALLLGADDYITRPFDAGELVARVRRCITRARSIGNGGPSDSNGKMEPTYGLTAREIEVLELLASGYGTRAIADRLVISPKTVATHIQRIMAKLGVHSRTAAVVRAHREGLVGADVEAHRLMLSL
jgi:DNA-binding NarL/FixJ family response regulator